jgi:hypothetical protein
MMRRVSSLRRAVGGITGRSLVRIATGALAGVAVGVSAEILASGVDPLRAAASTTSQAPEASPHGDLQIPCTVCHVTESWRVEGTPAGFDHRRDTGFALEGAHASAACAGCHADPVFSRVAVACADCHVDVHRGEFGFVCENCHEPAGWSPRSAAVERHAMTRFPLVGSHANADCDACHVGVEPSEFAATPVECVACHMDAYAAAADPPHERLGFDLDCEACHPVAARSWRPSTFSHAEEFPLLGAHARTACVSCHAGGYAGTPSECIACHADDYAAADPPHASPDFPETCETCHGFGGWSGAEFAHTGFPLLGAHARTACVACHAAGYAGTPSECIACHADDYAAADPPHAPPDFPETCETCHGFNGWSGAEFDHDGRFFPIYSGKHRDKWSACSDCHVDPGSYARFECINCHEHSQSAMDDKHREVNGYAYVSTACLACHPDGGGD